MDDSRAGCGLRWLAVGYERPCGLIKLAGPPNPLHREAHRADRMRRQSPLLLRTDIVNGLV